VQARISSLHKGTWPVLLYAGIPTLATAFLWATSAYELSLLQLAAAFSLCWIAWASYQHWRHQGRAGIPLFALIASVYWLVYALPLFWGEHAISLVTGYHRLSEAAITSSIYLALAGVVSLWVGMRLAKRPRWTHRIRLDVPENPWRWYYLRIVLVVSTLMKVLLPIDALGTSSRQILFNIEFILPSVAFVILLRSYLRGQAIRVDKFLLLGYFVIALVAGLSSGWLGNFVGVGIICIATYMLEKRRFPVVAMLVLLPVILFLQPGKAKFRERYWKGDPGESYAQSYAERIGFWIDASSEAWGRALSDPTGERVRALSGASLSRLSLLQPTANVIETTPAWVPYQHGRMYSYLVVTFIPRFLWPDKPSVNNASKWYQIAYHLTRPANIQSTGMAVGTAAESYISFGWVGPLMIMPCLGLFLGLFQEVFLRARSGLLLSGIGVASLPGLLSVESQMAVYIAGIVQQVLFAIIVLAPILEFHQEANPHRERSLLSYAKVGEHPA